MADLADLIERLKTGCVCIGSDEDNPGVELYDVEGASDTMAEAAAALSGQIAAPVAWADPACFSITMGGHDLPRQVTLSPINQRQYKQALYATPVSPAPDAEMVLSPANAKALLDAIETPPQPTEKLKELFRPDAGWREAFDEMLAALQLAAMNVVHSNTLEQIRRAISKAQAAGGKAS